MQGLNVGAVTVRWLGWIIILLSLLLVVVSTYLETSGKEWQARRELLNYPTSSFAMEFAHSSGEIACVLGEQRSKDNCIAPDGDFVAPTGEGVWRLRALTYLDFGLVLLYILILSATSLLAIRSSWIWLGRLSPNVSHRSF